MNYYKCVIADQNEATEHLNEQLVIIRDMCTSYSDQCQRLEQRNESLDKELAKLNKKYEREKEENEKKIR